MKKLALLFAVCCSLLSLRASSPVQIFSLVMSLTPGTTSNVDLAIQAIGGSGQYTYTLGGTTNSTGLFPSNPIGLAHQFIITVTDKNDPTNSQNANFGVDTTIFPLLPVTYSLFTPCNGQNNGEFKIVTGTPANPPIKSVLNGPNFAASFTSNGTTLADYTSLPPVTDPTKTSQFFISGNFFVQFHLASYGPITIGPISTTPPGTVTVTSATGGSGSFLYALDNVKNLQTSSIFTNVSPGTHTVFVADKANPNNCFSQQTISVPAANPILQFILQKYC